MAFSKGERKGRLLVYDSMAEPGRSISLQADLVEEGVLIRGPLGGEIIRFQVAERSLGTALTGGDGRAVKVFVPLTVGVLDLAVRLENSRRVEASEARGRIFVWDRRRPIAIVSHPALLAPSNKSSIGLPVPNFEGPAAVPNGKAIEALSVLSRRVHLLYVSPADRTELPDLRQWMDQHRLPVGPLFPVSAKSPALGRQIEAWRHAGWRNIRAGLVATPDEAGALIRAGIKAVRAPEVSAKEKWPDQTIQAKDWTDVVKHLTP
jgi:hypothetical protein